VTGELEPITITVTGKKVGKNKNYKGVTYNVTHNNYDPIDGAVQAVAMKSDTATKAWIPASMNIDNRNYLVRSVKANAFRGSSIKSVTVGANVKKLGAKMLYKSSATKVYIKSKLLTKDEVTNCFKGSNVKTVKVNASVYKTYRDIFSKSNCGKDVKVVKA